MAAKISEKVDKIDKSAENKDKAAEAAKASLAFEEADERMRTDPDGFREAVRASLRRQVDAIDALAARGMRFWDYGNAFLLEASRAGAPVTRPDGSFTYPSYVEDIMGPMCFDHGFGPFRWVCASRT